MFRWTEKANMKNRILAGILLCALCGCNKPKADEKAGDDEKPTPEVTLTKVERADLAQELMVSGNLAATPNHDAKVSALVPGRIARVLVTDGDEVKAGQALAEVESGPLQDAVHQAEAGVTQAKAGLENAKLSADRNEDLLKRGIAARKEVEDAHMQLSVTQAALKNAEAALSTAQTQLARAVIRAPFNGTVVKRFAGSGEQVDGTSATPILEIADISSLELLAAVPAARLSEIHSGETFAFESSSFPDRKFSGQIAAVLPAVDPGTNNGVARIHIDNPQHLMKLGMYVTLAVPLKGSGKKLVVARQAIYPDEAGEPHIYKVTGEMAEPVAVKLGAQTKDKVELLSGASEGDQVILTGGYGMAEKSKVKVVQPEVEKKDAGKDKEDDKDKKDTDDEKPAAPKSSGKPEAGKGGAAKPVAKPSPAKK